MREFTLRGSRLVHGVVESLESFFTNGERDLAISVAEKWQRRGWRPVLTSKSHRGEFETLLHYRQNHRQAA